MFICATVALVLDLHLALMPVSVSWPAKEPSFSASAMNGLQLAAPPRRVIEGKLTALEIAPRSR